MIFAGIYGIFVGVMMFAQWVFFLATGQVPELQTEPYRIAFHLAAECMTASGLIVAGIALLKKLAWGAVSYLFFAWMLTYSVIVSPGYFAQQHPHLGQFLGQQHAEQFPRYLPAVFQDAIHNLDVQVRWAPTPEERRRARLRAGYDLYGLYLGIPVTKRTHGYSMVLPDTILIYQRAHERNAATESQMVEQARQTLLTRSVLHGNREDRLQDLGVG
jgi:predicted Zn-dependent protease with MMP-like domain